MTVLSVPLGLLRYQPQHRRMRSSARLVSPIVKWACISKLDMKGDMFSGSSGATAPIGVQFLRRLVEIVWAVEDVGETTPNKRAMLFAS